MHEASVRIIAPPTGLEHEFHGTLSQAVNIIAAAPGVRSLIELNDLFRPALSALGFRTFAAMRLAKPDGYVHVRILFGEGIEPWLSYYLKMGYPADDCVLEECFRTSQPFFWSDIVARGGLSSSAARILKEAREFGLHQGFVAPMHRPDSSILAVLFAGELTGPNSVVARTASLLLASCYATTGSHLYSTESPSVGLPRGLTKRQIECLKWSLKGKSSTDISRIMDISPRVVDDHFARACKRLGVRTRAQAVHAASSLGYLDT
jgi:LuxR family transcriptional regulator, quorum-sensing system regulator BjaR1